MPITSFPAEFLELYRRAALETVTVELASPHAAKRLRARLHSLRVLMRKESHRYLTIAEGVQISVEGTQLIARPADQDFVSALHAAGIEIFEQPQDAADMSAPDAALARILDDE